MITLWIIFLVAGIVGIIFSEVQFWTGWHWVFLLSLLLSLLSASLLGYAIHVLRTT